MPQPLIQTQQLKQVQGRGLSLPRMRQQMSHPSKLELHLMGHQMRPPELTHPKMPNHQKRRILQHQIQPESGRGWPLRNYPFRRRLQHLRHRLPRPWRHR